MASTQRDRPPDQYHKNVSHGGPRSEQGVDVAHRAHATEHSQKLRPPEQHSSHDQRSHTSHQAGHSEGIPVLVHGKPSNIHSKDTLTVTQGERVGQFGSPDLRRSSKHKLEHPHHRQVDQQHRTEPQRSKERPPGEMLQRSENAPPGGSRHTAAEMGAALQKLQKLVEQNECREDSQWEEQARRRPDAAPSHVKTLNHSQLNVLPAPFSRQKKRSSSRTDLLQEQQPKQQRMELSSTDAVSSPKLIPVVQTSRVKSPAAVLKVPHSETTQSDQNYNSDNAAAESANGDSESFLVATGSDEGNPLKLKIKLTKPESENGHHSDHHKHKKHKKKHSHVKHREREKRHHNRQHANLPLDSESRQQIDSSYQKKSSYQMPAGQPLSTVPPASSAQSMPSAQSAAGSQPVSMSQQVSGSQHPQMPPAFNMYQAAHQQQQGFNFTHMQYGSRQPGPVFQAASQPSLPGYTSGSQPPASQPPPTFQFYQQPAYTGYMGYSYPMHRPPNQPPPPFPHRQPPPPLPPPGSPPPPPPPPE